MKKNEMCLELKKRININFNVAMKLQFKYVRRKFARKDTL